MHMLSRLLPLFAGRIDPLGSPIAVFLNNMLKLILYVAVQ